MSTTPRASPPSGPVNVSKCQRGHGALPTVCRMRTLAMVTAHFPLLPASLKRRTYSRCFAASFFRLVSAAFLPALTLLGFFMRGIVAAVLYMVNVHFLRND